MLNGYNNRSRYHPYNTEENNKKIREVFTMASYDDWQTVFGMLDRGFDVDTMNIQKSTPQRLLNWAFFHQNSQAFGHLINTYRASLDLALVVAKPDEREMMRQFAIKAITAANSSSIDEVEEQLKNLVLLPKRSGIYQLYKDTNTFDPVHIPSSTDRQ